MDNALQTLETQPAEEQVSLVPAESLFRPTELMCKIKARLHSRFEPSAQALDLSMLSRAQMIRLTGSSTINDWAKIPGFMTWLINPVYNEEKLEWLETLTYNALEDILLNEDPKAAGAKLQAAKLILEMRGKLKIKPNGEVVGVQKTESAVKNMTSEDLIKIIDVTKKKA